jgi:hypothetical protein
VQMIGQRYGVDVHALFASIGFLLYGGKESPAAKFLTGPAMNKRRASEKPGK